MVSITAVARAATLVDFAGAPAPAYLAGTDVPAVAGMKLSAVAEVHSSAVEGDPSVVLTSRQWSAVAILDAMAAHRQDCGPMDSMSVPELIEHSVVGVSLAGDDSSVDRVAVPNPIEHSGVSEMADLLSAVAVPEPLEHSVLEVPLEVGGGAVDGAAKPTTLEHAGVSKPADTSPASHPRRHSEVSEDGRNGQQDHMCEEITLQDIRRKDKRTSPEEGEAIVVGAVGSAAPWFLTGWAEEVEIEFMIDTGCQVTILATSVFERMCAADAQVRSRLHPCGHRLIPVDC